MDRSQLSSLKRPQLQQLARRETIKANLKNVEIIRLLLEKYPDGVPELAEKPSASEPIPSKAKRPTRGSKRKSAAKSGPLSVKAEETHPNVHIESSPDEPEGPHKGRDVRSMAPPPVTPIISIHPLRPSVDRRLPTTPLVDVVETQAEGGTSDFVDVRDVVRPPEATPTPPEAVTATSHQAHEMLRSLTDIIDATSLNPEEPSSILYRAKALSAILDTTVLPRMMKADKEVKDFVWMRVAVETKFGPRFKQEGILPNSRHSGVNIRYNPSFPTPRPPSPKRPREEGDGEGVPSQHYASKRTRVQ
ncbi:hypothetical protein BDM02DRAFT_1551574 [Thelephora ganbajun]|uniref:Uncharacterized protein n=1 Tax=Thelephora ganbajun TaxID=370292 RepID=A0ACB6ZUX9_THEGA|nr:hypothetical protein BDM02DRAFT_1551574 [Thelephora ganbajun]